MANEQNNIFYLPEIGDGVKDGTLIAVSVKPGEQIAADDPVCEIETDKATVDIPSTLTGTVKEVFVKSGDTIEIGGKIFSIGSEGESSKAKETKPDTEKASKKQEDSPRTENVEKSSNTEVAAEISSEQSLQIPDWGGAENDIAEVVSVAVKNGDVVKQGDTLAELETDKATIEIPSEAEGKIVSMEIKSGSKVKKGDPLATILASSASNRASTPAEKPAEAKPAAASEKAEKPVPAPQEKTTPTPSPQASSTNKSSIYSGKPVPASPHIRRFAREIGVSIQEVEGSGPRGRISIDDVKRYSKQLLNRMKSGSMIASAGPLPDFSNWGEIEIQPTNKIKQVTAAHMSRCWNTIPHVTQFDEADIDYLEKQRKRHKPTAEKFGVSLTITAILLKASGLTLNEFPNFNSSYNAEKQEIILKKYVNIGVAVDTPNGLMVPVIRNVDQKGILQLAKDLGDFSKKARDRKISPSDLQGGCFTISNLGGIAGTGFTPIVNWPEVAILGISKSSVKPVYIDGEFQPRLIMPLSLSYDHRVIDGAEAARFLARLIQYLEDPFLMNLGV